MRQVKLTQRNPLSHRLGTRPKPSLASGMLDHLGVFASDVLDLAGEFRRPEE